MILIRACAAALGGRVLIEDCALRGDVGTLPLSFPRPQSPGLIGQVCEKRCQLAPFLAAFPRPQGRGRTVGHRTQSAEGAKLPTQPKGAYAPRIRQPPIRLSPPWSHHHFIAVPPMVTSPMPSAMIAMRSSAGSL